MSLFLLVFFCVYGGTHLYFFIKAKLAFGFGLTAGACLGLFLVAMVLAPVMVRIAEREGLEITARIVAYIGYIWMGFLFLFFSASLLIDVYNLVILGVSLVSQSERSLLQISVKSAFIAACSVGSIASLYGYFEALDIRTERLVIESEKIPEVPGKLTIVQISDVHLGLIVREERLRRILDVVREARPDILVSTGDLVDGEINRLPGLAAMLGEIRPRYGKFAITGNHEVYAGLDKALDFTGKAGFRVLRNEAVMVDKTLTIAGVDDPALRLRNPSLSIDERGILSSIPHDRFVLLLKHRPVVVKDDLDAFDLQLSGHVHKGQLFPFNLVTHLFYPVKMGYSRYPSDSSLYVSRGTGTWGPPIRFLAPPEVTIIELIHGSGS
jgi:predicted MPP superfamily phosphohydrolase